jgi:hypothetical protein
MGNDEIPNGFGADKAPIQMQNVLNIRFAKGWSWRKVVIEFPADQFDFSDVASGCSNVCSREKSGRGQGYSTCF